MSLTLYFSVRTHVWHVCAEITTVQKEQRQQYYLAFLYLRFFFVLSGAAFVIGPSSRTGNGLRSPSAGWLALAESNDGGHAWLAVAG